MSARRSRAAEPQRRTPASPPARASAHATSLPSAREFLAPTGPYLLPLVGLLVSRVAMWFLNPAPAEDAFITFRYARNLAAGHGLVYNPGERVMGFTSPLWTLWNALGALLIRDPTVWGRASGVAADVVTLLAGGALVGAVGGRMAAWAFATLFSFWAYFAALGVSGMEMSACLALLVLGAVWVHGRHPGGGIVLAALALCRPEGLVAACIVAVGATWRQRIVAGAITLAGLIALTLYYGNPIPNSLLAKARLYGTPGPWTARHWWDWLSPVVLGKWPKTSEGTWLYVLVGVAAPAFVYGIRELWRRRDTGLALAAGASVAIWLGYAVLGVTYFWWYLAFPALALALVASVGLPRIVRGPAIPVALGLFVATSWSVSWQLYVGRARIEANTFGGMAAALKLRCQPGDTLMVEPIGMIGYASPVVVIDESGLVSPEVARRRLAGAGWYSDFVRARRPKWLVLRQGVLRTQQAFAGAGQPFRNAAERDSVLGGYREVVRSDEKDADQTLVLFERAG